MDNSATNRSLSRYFEQENIELTEQDATGHAETALVRAASKRYDQDLLAKCATFSLSCREVFARGQKTIDVVGPVKGVAQQILAIHQGYWNAD